MRYLVMILMLAIAALFTSNVKAGNGSYGSTGVMTQTYVAPAPVVTTQTQQVITGWQPIVEEREVQVCHVPAQQFVAQQYVGSYGLLNRGVSTESQDYVMDKERSFRDRIQIRRGKRALERMNEYLRTEDCVAPVPMQPIPAPPVEARAYSLGATAYPRR